MNAILKFILTVPKYPSVKISFTTKIMDFFMLLRLDEIEKSQP